MSSWLHPRIHPSGRWVATTAGASWHRVGLAKGARPPRRYSRCSAGRRRPEPASPWTAQRLGAAPGAQPRVFFEAQRFGENPSGKTRCCRFVVQGVGTPHRALHRCVLCKNLNQRDDLASPRWTTLVSTGTIGLLVMGRRHPPQPGDRPSSFQDSARMLGVSPGDHSRTRPR